MNASGFSEQRDCYRPDEKQRKLRATTTIAWLTAIEIFQRVLADKNQLPAKSR